MPPQDPPANLLSDGKLRAAITRDLRAIYADVVQEPLPAPIAAALERLELPPTGEEDSHLRLQLCLMDEGPRS